MVNLPLWAFCCSGYAQVNIAMDIHLTHNNFIYALKVDGKAVHIGNHIEGYYNSLQRYILKYPGCVIVHYENLGKMDIRKIIRITNTYKRVNGLSYVGREMEHINPKPVVFDLSATKVEEPIVFKRRVGVIRRKPRWISKHSPGDKNGFCKYTPYYGNDYPMTWIAVLDYS